MNIISFAFKTRICVILLQSISNHLIPDHDAVDVFVSPQPPPGGGDGEGENWCNWLVEVLLGGLNRWDAQYFLHIATHGYSYENTLAFSPLYPLIVGVFGRIVHSLVPILSLYHWCLVLAVGANVWFFIRATEFLHELSLRLTGNRKWAQMVAVLFCLNPASIFFTAPYSEALFAYLTFWLMLEASDNVPSLRTIIPLSLSLIGRSNGLSSIGFVIYSTLRACCSPATKKFNNKMTVIRNIFIICTPLFVYGIVQMIFYDRFCSGKPIEHDPVVKLYAQTHGLQLAGTTTTTSDWCNYSIPLSYAYVQDKYWNVGFLRYYQWKQIPNFIVATPILACLLYYCFTYMRTHFWYCLHLGLFESKTTKKITLFERQILPFIFHGLFLTLVCIFFVHIQVSTRILASATPLLYWFCANFFKDTTINGIEDIYNVIFKSDSFVQKCILIYFISYSIIGTILFSNFLPWT